jgi:hypothetical protein
MLLSGCYLRGWAIFLSGGVGLCAFACGSDDDKVVDRFGDAGAGGAADAGAPTEGGSSVVAGATSSGGTGIAGAPSDAAGQSAGGAPGAGGIGAGGEPALGGAGGEGGPGGAPSECSVEGSVTGLDVASDAIYQGCRGGVVRATFVVDDASATFQCCGVSTPTAALSVPVLGEQAQDVDGAVRLSFEVPSDTAPGSYSVGLTCPTTSAEQVIAVEINEGVAPSILSISTPVAPGGFMNIQGNGLASVREVRGVRASDGSSWACDIDLETQSDTEIYCLFPENLPLSNDEQDIFFIDVVDEDCGAAPSPPPFWVELPK